MAIDAEAYLHGRMLQELVQTLATPLGENGARVVASDALRDLIDDPTRDMEECFRSALLIGHRSGADRVTTARACELAAECVELVGNVVLEVRAELEAFRSRGHLASPPRSPVAREPA